TPTNTGTPTNTPTPSPCGDLPCVVPTKNPFNTVTVTNCSGPSVTISNTWTQISLPGTDVILQCALTPLAATTNVRIIARSIKVDGSAGGSVSAFGRSGVQLTASASPCADATIEIVSTNLNASNPNGDLKVTACGDIVAVNSSLNAGGNVVLTSTGGRICAA